MPSIDVPLINPSAQRTLPMMSIPCMFRPARRERNGPL